jgi:dGTPase
MHNGPLTDREGNGLKAAVPQAVRDFSELFDLELDRHASLEAQCAAIADDIAYDTHDIDDGLRAGLLTLDMLGEVALPGEILGEVRSLYPALDSVRTGHELMRRQITVMVEDVIAATVRRIDDRAPASAEDVRLAGVTLAAFSDGMAELEAELKSFLYRHLYRAPEVLRVRAEAERVVTDLFDAYFAHPRAMPEGWREGLEHAEDRLKARHVADFLAGMTDTYALKEHRRLFDHTPVLS